MKINAILILAILSVTFVCVNVSQAEAKVDEQVYYDISDQLDYELYEDPQTLKVFEETLDAQINGFWELRAGYRLQNDKNEKDMSISEARMQVDIFAVRDWAEFHFKGDFHGSLVDEEGHFDAREINMAFSPHDDLDVKIGRQVLTWGTGDLLFLNDLFPKNWKAFFIGMEQEYLKDPSDAARFTLYNDFANVDFVYAPQFDPSTYPTGEYVSYFNPMLGDFAGQNAIISADRPDRLFRDDEFSYRVYKNINNYEIALYGYNGYWKSPGGMNSSMTAIFPDLNVYGASIRGKFADGIGNLETAFYDSAEDRTGTNPMINNSEFRFLAGYAQEIGQDLTISFQYYLEYMLDYDDYVASVTGMGMPVTREKDYHRLTCRVTKYMFYHMLKLSCFTYYSPREEDAYIMPNITLKASDQVALELGANIFLGEQDHTFFGQFENNTNIYAAVRYSF